MARRFSIQTQLMASIVTLVVMVLGIALAAGIVVSRISHNAEVIDQKWLVGTQALARLQDQVAKFRLAETDRALRDDIKGAGEAEVRAQRHRDNVESAITSFTDVVGVEAQDDVAAFRDAWANYLLIHDAWVRAFAYRNTRGIALASSSLDWRYRAVDQALGRLQSETDHAAQIETAAASELAATLTYLMIAVSLATVLMALGVSAMIRRTITQPLAAMTTALTQLAGGSLGVSLPERHRDDEIGAMANAFEVFRANAFELEQAHDRTRVAQSQADLLARHDALTGLPNRRVFAAELDIALARSEAGVAFCAVMLIDLDRFKPINDVRGHAAGDQVLCEVARRLNELPARRKLVARLGGDEFAVILETEADVATLRDDAMALAAKVLSSVQEPIVIGDASVGVGASIGIACCPMDGTVAEDVIRASDLAMYRAKQSGRGTFRFFEHAMDEDLRLQAKMDDKLRQAIMDGQIRPFYQPLIGLGQELLHGFEVLARWQDPDDGPVPPDRFIAMAERLGLMQALTTSILRQSCREARSWGEVSIAVNVSPSQLADRTFPAKVFEILENERFPPSRLEIEITESALVGDIELAKEILTSLQSAGISISLDDFGTGYSSLYHLRNLKFDKLKLDRSFVQSLRTNPESAKIVDAVLGLARSLGMPVVAEGIEDQAALTYLTQRGCEFGQGFLFSKAVSGETAAGMLMTRAYKKSA